jgi:hypothetical protein
MASESNVATQDPAMGAPSFLLRLDRESDTFNDDGLEKFFALVRGIAMCTLASAYRCRGYFFVHR